MTARAGTASPESGPVKEEAVTLLPCPFCSGPGHMEFSEYDLSDGYHVICHGKKTCPLFYSDPYCVFETKAEATTAWNTRQADPRIAELEAALKEVRTNVRDMQRIMLNSWSHESSSAKQAIETIDAVLNRKDKP